MSDVIIVDSDDFQLSDRNKWVRNGLPREYGASTFYAVEVGPTWSYTFVGSTVEVLGALRPGLPNTDVEFYIDNSLAGTFTSPTIDGTEKSRWHQSFFKKTGLDPNTNHTIQGRQATLPDPNQKGPIFFDYILYTPSKKTVFDKTTRFFIDDRDTRVNFSHPRAEDWVLPSGGNFTYDDFFGRGITNTTDPSNVVTFSFTGTKIEVFGCKDVLSTPRSNFTLDSNAPAFISLQAEPDDELRYNVALWESPALQGDVQHTLRMNHVDGTGGLCLDYFLVTPAVQSPGFFDSTGLPPYAIALSVLTGVFGLIILGGLAWWFLRRRRRTRSGSESMSGGEEEDKDAEQDLSFTIAPEMIVTPFSATSSSAGAEQQRHSGPVKTVLEPVRLPSANASPTSNAFEHRPKGAASPLSSSEAVERSTSPEQQNGDDAQSRVTSLPAYQGIGTLQSSPETGASEKRRRQSIQEDDGPGLAI